MRVKCLWILMMSLFVCGSCEDNEQDPPRPPVDAIGAEIDEPDGLVSDVEDDQDTAQDASQDVSDSPDGEADAPVGADVDGVDPDTDDGHGTVVPTPEWILRNVDVKRLGEPKWQLTEVMLANLQFGAGVTSGDGYKGFFECVIGPWNGLDGDQVIPISEPLDSITRMPTSMGRALNEQAQACLLSNRGEPWEPAYDGESWGEELDFGRGRGVMFVAAVEPTLDAPRGRSFFKPDEPLLTNAIMPLSIEATTVHSILPQSAPARVWNGSQQLSPITGLRNTADPACQSDPNACMNFEVEGATHTLFTLPLLSLERDNRPSFAGTYGVQVVITDQNGDGWQLDFQFFVAARP